MTVLIAGAGIAGLAMGLTLHQLGIPFRIYERVGEMRPLGVGINIQPNAVRELYDLGLQPRLDAIGVRTRQYGFYTKTGLEIWAEPRGQFAGYTWPQYSIHRGQLQMMLLDELRLRAGADCVVTGAGVLRYETRPQSVRLILSDGTTAEGDLVIAADGIRSAIRAQMLPDEGEPIWNGAIMWRGVSRAAPFLGGAAMILSGHDTQRFVAYPISATDPETGLADMNWIAELRVDPGRTMAKGDWNKPADPAEFLPAFEDWDFGWVNCPEMIRNVAGPVYEYPMVDREPMARWTDGRVTLTGDAAHATYPVGSNGASQAIIDARKLGAALRDHGVTPAALETYEAEMRPRAEGILRANRGAGPDAVMQMVEDRCAGVFDKIDDVIPRADLAAHAEKYKRLSGFSIDVLNAQPAILGPMDRAAE
ncbi:flavin-dependent oxidoreductase [Seohaeicola saemankumensis]|uniref:flavin-dependent oxidoreductase n=1 Tax=Seohaeicola saemankumensis TaxID=481181 RepID=UPI001E2AF6F0|nr:flavin-dependent oxidoreductase [Seohaeicola saemankumensis]MCD1627475.1 flavin-dependent oxidoreductase [Seohaeicola saemankumensis]